MAIRFTPINPASAPGVPRGAAPMTASSGRDMTRYHQTKVGLHRKPGEDSSARLVAFLRRQHPTKTAEAVSARTGIPANTVATWLKGTSVPSWGAIWTLVEAYEADFIAAVLPNKAGWLADAVRAEELRQIQAQRAALDARAEALGRC